MNTRGSLQGFLHGEGRGIRRSPLVYRPEGILEDFASSAPKALETLERGYEDATAVLSLPPYYRTRLRTTNSVERLNEEIRRRERVIRIFPNEASAMRLVGALLAEQHEVWITGKRHFNMEEYWQWKNAEFTEKQRKDERAVAD